MDSSQARAHVGRDLERRLSMPSGPNRFSLKYSPSFLPLTVSTILPAKSMLIPYSQRSPGSNINGIFKESFLQAPMPGSP